jgi:hypothetical protein
VSGWCAPPYAAAVLRHEQHPDQRHQHTFGGETRSFASFSAPLDEIVQARIWAGLHFRTADEQGRDLGINVANYAADNYFQPVGDTEPAATD